MDDGQCFYRQIIPHTANDLDVFVCRNVRFLSESAQCAGGIKQNRTDSSYMYADLVISMSSAQTAQTERVGKMPMEMHWVKRKATHLTSV